MPRTWARRATGTVALLTLAVSASVLTGYTLRYHLLPRRFAVVEEGRIYRSAFPKPYVLRNIIENKGLKTVLTLLKTFPGSERDEKEEALCAEHGVQVVRIGMPGDGRGTFDALDKAADLLADPQRYPVLVHCSAGVNRTGAAIAAYRMRHCGWSLEQALAESDRFGWPLSENPELCEHLRSYYRERIAPQRQTPAQGG